MTLSPRSWSPFFWRTYVGHKGKSIKVVFSSLKHTQHQITKTFKCDGCNKFCVDLSIVTMIWELDSVTNSQRPVKHHGCWEANSHRQFFWSFKSVGINMTALFSKFSLLRAQTCICVYAGHGYNSVFNYAKWKVLYVIDECTVEENHFVHRSPGALSGYAWGSFLPFVAKHISCICYCLSFATLSSIFNAEVQWLMVLRIHHCGGNWKCLLLIAARFTAVVAV